MQISYKNVTYPELRYPRHDFLLIGRSAGLQPRRRSEQGTLLGPLALHLRIDMVSIQVATWSHYQLPRPCTDIRFSFFLFFLLECMLQLVLHTMRDRDDNLQVMSHGCTGEAHLTPLTLRLDISTKHIDIGGQEREIGRKVRRLGEGPVRTVPRPASNPHAYTYRSQSRTIRPPTTSFKVCTTIRRIAASKNWADTSAVK